MKKRRKDKKLPEKPKKVRTPEEEAVFNQRMEELRGVLEREPNPDIPVGMVSASPCLNCPHGQGGKYNDTFGGICRRVCAGPGGARTGHFSKNIDQLATATLGSRLTAIGSGNKSSVPNVPQ